MSEKKSQLDDKNNELRETDILLTKLTEVIKDSYSIAILTELMINEKITANELKEKPSIKNVMKKSVLYSRLKDLEDQNLITSDYEVQKTDNDRGYAVKKYSLKKDFIELVEKNISELSKTKPREARIFGLYMIKSFLNREIERILGTSNEDLLHQKGDIKNAYGGILTLKRSEYLLFQEKFGESLQSIKPEEEDISDDKTFEPYGFYYGFFYLPEKDKLNS